MKDRSKILLKAGPLQMTLVHGTIKNVVFMGETILTEIYGAVRDCNWGTVPYEVQELYIDQKEDKFQVNFQAVHMKNEIFYKWKAQIVGKCDGTLEFSFHGTALSDFEKNRIGFCVLYPGAFEGAPCRVIHTVEEAEEGQFPKEIAPHQPYKDIRELICETPGKAVVSVTYQGEQFEMEDQRNWTDDSFKVYGTPLDLPFPVKVKIGDKAYQKLSVKILRPPEKKYEYIEDHKLYWDTKLCLLPRIGTCWRHGLDSYWKDTALKAGFTHVRYEVGEQKEWETLEEVLTDLKARKLRVLLVIFFTDQAEKECEFLQTILKDFKGTVEEIFVLKAGRAVPEWDFYEWIKNRLSRLGLPVGTGSNGYFTQINRERFPVLEGDFVAYSNTPQVHAFDEEAMFSTVHGQMENVKSCKALYPQLPVYVSPISLKIRWNPDAVIPSGNEWALGIDERQGSLFAAVWTLASLGALAQAGAARADYYELFGPKGIMGRNLQDPDFTNKWAVPKIVYPVYFVFYWLLGRAWEKCFVGQNDKWIVLCLEAGRDRRILVGNKCSSTCCWQLEESGERAAIQGEWLLDQTCVEQAQEFPFQWLESTQGSSHIQAQGWIEMPAYALLCIDIRK